MLAKHGIWTEPITGLILAAAVAAAIGLGSGLVLLRTRGLTLLMLTLCTMALLEEAANLAHEYTGGFDGLDSLPIRAALRHVRVQSAVSDDAVSLRPRRAVRVLRLRAHAGLFAVRAEPDRHPREHAAHARGRGAGARRGSSSATRSRRRSPASPAGSGRRPTPTSTSARSASTARRRCSSSWSSAATGGSTARSSAPSPTWRSRTSCRRSIPPPGSSGSGSCSS